MTLNENSVISTLENMSAPLVARIGSLRVDAVEEAHAIGKVGFWRFDDQMVMIRHLAPGMNAPSIAGADFANEIEPGGSVDIVPVDGFAAVAAGCDVIQAARKGDSQRT